MTDESAPAWGVPTPPESDDSVSIVIHSRISSGHFVQLPIEWITNNAGKSVSYSTHVNKMVTIYCPEVDLTSGLYDLHVYSPLLEFSKPIRVYGIYPSGHVPSIFSKDDPDKAFPNAYLFVSYLPVVVKSSYLMAQVVSRMAKLQLRRIDANTLSGQGLTPQLLFRNKHLVMHGAPGLFTLISSTNLGERMESVLTSV